MTFLQTYLLALGLILACMILLWLLSLRLRNSSIVDIFWGSGFVLANWLYFALGTDGYPLRKWLAAALVTVWGLRLTLHILRRNWGRSEDFRYQAMRAKTGKRWWWQSLFQVFLLQGILLWLISAPLLAAQRGTLPDRLTVLDLAGALLWAVGFFFEAAGDAQLARFKADPGNRGRVLDTGVWRLTRHPNYFGDAAQWWGYYLLAAAAGGWFTVFGPLLMTLFLLRVSGVALLEKTMETRPGYRDYIRRTSAFVPWFPRRLPSDPGKEEK